MKSTGIVRKVDELGRVVLPIELRRNMGIEIKDSLEIFVEESTIILKKYEPADIFTGSMDDLIDYKGWNGMEIHTIPAFSVLRRIFKKALLFSVKNPDLPDITGFFLDKVCTALLQYNP